MSKRWWFVLSVVLAGPVIAQVSPTPSTRPGATAVETTDVPLGELFESRIAGIQFHPPAGGTLVRQVNSGDIVRFVYADKNWDLRAKLVHLAKPVPLSASATGNDTGGLLEMTVDQLTASNPSAKILYQQVRDLKPYRVGLIEARYNQGVARVTTREAIFRSDDQTYYVLQLTSPGKNGDDASPDEDDAESLATRTFQKVLETVKLLDRGELYKEQVQRLFHTRELFATWSENRLKAALVSEQFLRVIREGKDVGYIQERDQVTKKADSDGVQVMLRLHVQGDTNPVAPPAPANPAATGTVLPSSVLPAEPAAPAVPAGPTRMDRLVTMFVSFDRRHEQWSTQTVIDNGQGTPVRTSELGNSDQEIRRALDRSAMANGQSGDKLDPKEPPVRQIDRYHLSVATYARTRTGVPVERDLPVFYVPQALAHLLPRLLPLDEPRTYMFASYVSEQKEVMSRYVDVLREQDVMLDGKKIRAIPVTDRIGVEGSPTTHYMSRDSQWLGSVNEDQNVTVLPSDKETIQQLWKDANLNDIPVTSADGSSDNH